MRTEDGSIIQECLNGEPEAFGVLVDKYKAGIYAFACAKLGDFRDAQDVTQEVFVQAYRGLRSLRRWESFAFWLYRIAYTRCARQLQVRSKRIDSAFIEDQSPKIMDLPSLNSYREIQVSESVRDALDLLPEIYREALMLRYFGGMNSNEIAKAIGTSPAAVRKRLSRARAQMKKEMVAMMDTAFEGQKLQASFTFQVVDAIKHIKINPMPRMAGLPWGLSVAMGIIIAVLSLNPPMTISSDMAIPAGLPLPAEMKVLKTGEIPVDILEISEISVTSSKQGDGDGVEIQPQMTQNTFMLAPRAEEGKWTKKAEMPTGRALLATSVVDGKIYAIGGTPDGFTPLVTLEEYNPVTDKWTKKADMIEARQSLSASVVNGKIYVIGGWSGPGNFPSIVEEYDPIADKWTKKGGMLKTRSELSTGVVNGRIYAIGGGHGVGNAVPAVEEYDPATDTWTEKADMPKARQSFSVSTVNGKIYAIGGEVQGVPVPTVEEYDPVADKWTKKADMIKARQSLSTSVVNGKIYAIGGGSDGGFLGAILPTVEEYDPIKDTWTKKADMLTARGGFSASVVDGRIYAIGGAIANWTLISPAVEEYTPEGWRSVSLKGKLPTTWGEVKSE